MDQVSTEPRVGLDDLFGMSYVDSATRLTKNIYAALRGTGLEPKKVLKGIDDPELAQDTISAFKKDLTENTHATAKSNMYKVEGMNDDIYKKYVGNAFRNHEKEYVPKKQQKEKKLKAVQKPRTNKVPPISPSIPNVTPPPEDIVAPSPEKKLKTDTVPETYDTENTQPKFDNQRLSKTAPISSLDLYHNMAWQGMQQLGLMAATSYLGQNIGPEAAAVMYQGMHALNKMYNTHGATPVEMAASQGLEALNEMVENGGIVKAHNKFNALRRGQLESVTTVDQQVISAFAKGLRTMNSVQQAQQALQQQYKTAFGGI